MGNGSGGETSVAKENRDVAPESSERVDRRAFVQWAAGAVAGGAVAGGFPEIAAAQQKGRSDPSGGSLYKQKNEIQNAIIHHHREAKRALPEEKRVPPRPAGPLAFNPLIQINTPTHIRHTGPRVHHARAQRPFKHH